MMVAGDDDNDVNEDGAMGNEVDDDGDGVTGDDDDDDNDDDDDDDDDYDDGDGDGAMGSGQRRDGIQRRQRWRRR